MKWLRELFRSGYVRMLEEECGRLRVEKQGWQNIALGKMGLEPVESAASPPGPPQIRRSGLSWHQRRAKTERESWAKVMGRGQDSRAEEANEEAGKEVKA